jgi:cob(I)alamin adenosyltransferase
MPKLTRIYTRTGDAGTTGLIGGARIKKNALRIETYGTVDELSSAIGVARAALSASTATSAPAARLDAWLAWTQDMLFNLGCELATLEKDRREGSPRVAGDAVSALERAIDAAQLDLAPLANFIHPGGSTPGAALHFARTICRRAERLAVTLLESEGGVPPQALRYLNRLSDALFVWARWINDDLRAPEHIWNPSSKPPEA